MANEIIPRILHGKTFLYLIQCMDCIDFGPESYLNCHLANEVRLALWLFTPISANMKDDSFALIFKEYIKFWKSYALNIEEAKLKQLCNCVKPPFSLLLLEIDQSMNKVQPIFFVYLYFEFKSYEETK